MSDLIEIARQAIERKGFDYDKCYKENIPVRVINTEKSIDANNEFYFLYDVNNSDDAFIIIADNDVVSSLDFVVSGMPSGFRELTGQLNVITTGDTTFLFHRVVLP